MDRTSEAQVLIATAELLRPYEKDGWVSSLPFWEQHPRDESVGRRRLHRANLNLERGVMLRLKGEVGTHLECFVAGLNVSRDWEAADTRISFIRHTLITPGQKDKQLSLSDEQVLRLGHLTRLDTFAPNVLEGELRLQEFHLTFTKVLRLWLL